MKPTAAQMKGLQKLAFDKELAEDDPFLILLKSKGLHPEMQYGIQAVPSKELFPNNSRGHIFGFKYKYEQKQFTLTTLAIKDLFPSQSGVNTGGLKTYFHNRRPDPPEVVRYNGKYYLQEGHTRTGADILHGISHIKVKLYEYDDNTGFVKKPVP